ncbi:MAG TPA: GNAT family N-acetyltransferase [Allosphingosinicella sp.]|nr:GNAT family N-acetyltransferase [Allosphingosinicella sp.]
MARAERDDALREMAANRGLKLVKSRRRTPGRGDYGRYGLTDAAGAELLGFGRNGLTATAEEIEDYLHKGAAADWKGSLSAAGGKTRPKPARRPSPEPEPEPEPPLAVRPARPADAAAIAGLLADLGHRAGASEIAARLARLRKAGEVALVADRGEAIGVLTWHVTPVLHRPSPVGRITMIAVAERQRRRGVGRALVEAASEQLRKQGCGLIEVTSNADLSGAHAFYRKLGFERTSYRFAKPLD